MFIYLYSINNNKTNNKMKNLTTTNIARLILLCLSFVMLSICLFNLLTSTFDSPNVKMFMNGIAFSTIAIFFTINSLKK